MEDQKAVMLGSNFKPYTRTLNNARVIFGASVAVGKDNFETIIRDCLTFVDKSMLIKEFIESSDFISYSQEENVICSQLFEKLKISTEKEIMQKHFVQYPIIHISLKDLNAGTWDKMIEKLRILIAKIYREHRYLISSLYPEDQEIFQRILKRDPTYPESQLSFALQELSMYLRQHYKKQCIVLIDEYDSPMKCAYNKGYYEVANEFFKGMFSSLLKSNDENVAKAMLVDSSPLYVDKFGFTSDEIELLLSLRKNLQINDVQKWYDGYISGGSTHLYNLWSIICLLSRGILCAYWTDTGSTQTLEKCLWKASSSFKESVEKLLKGESITNAKVQDDLRYLHLDQCQDLAIWTLLYYAGYLTMNSEKHLVIPNEEIRSEWHNWVINVPFFTKGQTITSMLDNLLHGNLDLFKYVYHAFCLGVFANARDRGFIVHSNREAGFGRYD
ncbi:31132_t:CDS:2, partial [Gigaspora margarita]